MRVLRALAAMDHHRHDSLVQAIQDPAEQNSHSMGTMAVCSPCPLLALHRRAPANLVLPPHVSVLRPQHVSPVPEHLQDGFPDRCLLRPRGYLALLDAPRHALRLPLQEHPQDPPPVLGSLRSRRRIRLAYRGYGSRTRHCQLAYPLVRDHWRSAYSDHVPVDRLTSVPGYRCTQRLRVPLELAPFPSLLGRRRAPRRSPRTLHRQLLEQLQVVGLRPRHRGWS